MIMLYAISVPFLYVGALCQFGGSAFVFLCASLSVAVWKIGQKDVFCAPILFNL